MNKTAIVTGIPGTGKTTVCGFVEKLGREAGVHINVVNYGTVMMGILQESGRSLERDGMRKDSVDVQRSLQKQVAEAIAEKARQTSGLTIIDTHMSIKTPEGYFPGLSSNNLSTLKPDLLVLVEAKPNEISSRRLKDKSRKRDPAMEESVTEELNFSRAMACACAVLMSVPVRVVVNSEGKPEEAAKQILGALRGPEK
jgi:adenylate kinase